MSDITSNIVLNTITATFTPTINDIVIVPEAIDLTISTYGGGAAKALSANIGNVHIFDGLNGQYLQTDGTGNLSWSNGGGSGNGVVGGTNTQVQFNNAGLFGGNAGFTFNKTNGNLNVPSAIVATSANISNVIISGNSITTPGYYGDITGGNLFSAYTMNASIQITSPNVNANAVTANYVFTSNVIGNITFTGDVSATGNITSLTSIGYKTGSGGSVTQTGSRTSNVTLNKPTGQITLVAGALTANTQQQFTLLNSYILATDMVLVQHISGGTLGLYNVTATPNAGNAVISIRNNSNATSGTQTPVLQFMVLRSATS